MNRSPSESPSSGRLRVERRHLGDGTRIELILDRPHKRNALSRPLLRAATAAVHEASAQPDLRALVLRGTGPVFCAGADISDMRQLKTPDEATAFIREVHGLCQALRDVPVPTIALIQGAALGGGLEAAAACDLRIGTVDSRYGMPEVRVGLPSVIEAALLPRLIGWGRAADLVLCGHTIAAGEALSWGLLNAVVETGALDDALRAKLADLQRCDPLAVRKQKELMRVWERGDLAASIDHSIAVFGSVFDNGPPRALALR
jgi:enoyl-CoA hydratase/carnithine racemase